MGQGQEVLSKQVARGGEKLFLAGKSGFKRQKPAERGDVTMV